MASRWGALLAVLILDVAVAAGCALWPLWPAKRSSGSRLEDLGWSGEACNGNADIGILAIIRCLLFVGIWVCSSRWYGAKHNDRVRVALWTIGYTFMSLLSVKMIVVASCGAESRWPEMGSGRAGLVMIFIPLVLGLLFVHMECTRLEGILKPLVEKSADLEAGVTAPLLGDHKKSEEEDVKSQNLFQELVRLARPDAAIMWVALVCGMAAAVLSGLIPMYAGQAIDYAAIDSNRSMFTKAMVLLVLAAVGNSILVTGRGGLFSLLGYKLSVRIRHQLLASLLRQEIAFYDVTGSGSLSSRLQGDTTSVSQAISLNVNVLARALMQMLVVLFLMAKTSWRLTVITLVVVPVGAVVTQAFGARYEELQKSILTELAKVNSSAEEALAAITTIRAHAAEASTEAFYVQGLARVFKLQVTQTLVYCGYICFCALAPNATLIGVLFLGGHLVLEGVLSAGELVSFILYMQTFADGFQSLGYGAASISNARGSVAKVAELIHRKPQIEEAGHYKADHFDGHVELRSVSHSYPTRPDSNVLEDLSVEMRPGEVVALVGPSGGGKSTIMKLLQRFYIPQSGRVLFDGRDISDFEQHWLKRNVGVVGQEPSLFDRTIRRNVIFGMEPEDGMEPPTQEQIEEACRMANAHDFISGLPDGYDTVCGENGVQLSGGQKQRIAIARALVRNPKVLMLDEATSALDAESEALVQEALERCQKNRTVLVVAHRLSTIKGADRIVVVKGGRLVETGTHTELLAKSGIYASLVRRQMQGMGSSLSLASEG
eukprot:evm.model.scf_877.3 EVM.evm.TU.scf_877.3   scf_877:25850-35458(+)